MSTPAGAIAAYAKYREEQAKADEPAPEEKQSAAPAPTDPHAAAQHAIRLLAPVYRAEHIRQAAAVIEAERSAAPPARDGLSAAHAERAAAAAEADRLRQAHGRARDHHTEAEGARDEAKKALDLIEADDADRLISELSSGLSGRAEPTGGAQRLALADCEHRLAIAMRAVDTLAGELAAAETRLTAARQAVDRAVCGVLLEIAHSKAVAILRAADDLDAERPDLDSLAMQITNLQRGHSARAWPAAIRTALEPQLRDPPRLPSSFTGAAPAAVKHWAAIAARLVADAEAEIA